jgi:MFS transporter, AAHS family, 4-hydroxybenzoate transporter
MPQSGDRDLTASVHTPLARTEATVDVAAVIDSGPVSVYQLRITVLCACVALLDGFDAQALAFVAPLMIEQWGMDAGSFGVAFGAGLAGLAIGAMLFGPLADRFGRKRVILTTVALFGICSMLTAFASSFQALLVLRFATGLGIGGSLPNAVALTAEYMPQRIRATATGIMICGFPMGAFLGGLLSSRLAPVLGWESVFIAGGMAPLLLLPVIAQGLPESVRFLALHNPRDNRIGIILHRMQHPPTMAGETRFFVPEQDVAAGFPVTNLFRERRALATILIWVAFFMNLLMIFFLVSWLPSVLHDAGIPLHRAILAAALYNLGGVVGSILLTASMDRIGAYQALTLGLLGGAVSSFCVGLTTHDAVWSTISATTAGAFVAGAQAGLIALAASVYPTALRSTGLGWALGIGRIGSIVGPLVGGYLISAGIGTERLFALAAMPALVSVLAILLLARHASAIAELPRGH